MDITNYLMNNGIVVGKDFFSRNIEDKKVINIDKQLELIVFTQSLLMKQKETIIPRIDSSIGKDIENFKVQIKRNTRAINLLKEKKNKEKLDFFIAEEGTKIIKKATDTLEALDNELYLRLIKRSMKNNEVCLGRVDEGNLKVDNYGVIKIRTVKYISYNLVESDCYSYIKRLKRHQYKENINDVIRKFIHLSALSNESGEYIKILVNYPLEQMRVLSKYRVEGNMLSEEEWIKEINLANKKDGNELL